MTDAATISSRSRTTGRDSYDHLVPTLVEYAGLDRSDPRRRVLRDRLATTYLPVVHHIARRYSGRGEPTSDLEQVGAVALLGALERFDTDRGADFLSFAIPTITGEIRKHFRDRTWSMRVPRRLKDLQGPIAEAVTTLSAELGRAPRPSEIAAHLGVPLDEIVDALGAQRAYSADSLDALTHSGDTSLLDLLGQADAELVKAEYRNELRRALADLPDRERTIVILRFFGDLTQTEIAAKVGLSQMHVSRLLASTLAGLRARIDVS